MFNTTVMAMGPGTTLSSLGLDQVEMLDGAYLPYLVGLSGLGIASSLFFQDSDESLSGRVRYLVGFAVAINFLVFWVVPIVVYGALFKLVLMPYLCPIYDALDQSERARSFSKKYVYRDPRHADFFATQALFLGNFVVNLAFITVVFHRWGYLPWWAIYMYYFGWVGPGGRCMGAAYAIAHKEGHNTFIYKPWLRNVLGNIFENWIGLFYGGVPYNFTTTHISIHHKLDAACGDTLYVWDLERCNWTHFVQYQSRALYHMTGIAALQQFYPSTRIVDRKHFRKLLRGVLWYWVLLPVVLLYLVPSLSYYFWVVIQPLLCMALFVSLVNAGFHAFLEPTTIPCVESATLMGSYDDYFGEDDHMTHHIHPEIYYRDLPEYQQRQIKEWATHHATVFQGIDAFSFGVLVYTKAWPVLATRYMDYSNSLSQEQIEKMLETRAKRIDMKHDRLMPKETNVAFKRFIVDRSKEEANASWFYRRFTEKSIQLQLAIAKEMDKGLPPIKKKST